MTNRLAELQTARQLVADSRSRVMAAHDAEISRLDKLVLAELVEAGEAYWALWYGDDYDYGRTEVEVQRKPFETYDQAVDYLRDEIVWDHRTGVEGPPVDLGLDV